MKETAAQSYIAFVAQSRWLISNPSRWGEQPHIAPPSPCTKYAPARIYHVERIDSPGYLKIRYSIGRYNLLSVL